MSFVRNFPFWSCTGGDRSSSLLRFLSAITVRVCVCGMCTHGTFVYPTVPSVLHSALVPVKERIFNTMICLSS